MVPSKKGTCQQKHTDTNNSKKKEYQNHISKLSESSQLNKYQLQGWTAPDIELLEWFFDYLDRYPGTKKNPIYSILKEKIIDGPFGNHSIDGSLRSELSCMKTLIERNGY